MSFITLFQLNNLIQNTLDQQLDTHYWVVAEIGEIRLAQKGHCYLELIEKDGQHLTAKAKANIWAYDYRNLSNFFQSVTGKKLQAGMKILAKVNVQFHEVYGLSLHVRDLDPNFTLGERARQRQQVIERLTQEGILDRNGLLSLPLVPQRVAVISAETAAGYGDFISQLVNNQQGYRFDVKLFKSVMQGDMAVDSIIKSLQNAYKRVNDYDVLIIVRGGGSQIDFDCFDNYEVAKVITDSPFPIITGIGHDRDETVVDLVAHTKLKTPTAVAEFLLSGMKAFDLQMDNLSQRLKLSVMTQIQIRNTQLLRLGTSLDHKTKNLIQRLNHRQDLLSQRITLSFERQMVYASDKLRNYEEFLSNYPFKIITQEQRLISSLESKVAMADPQRILERGFSITYKNGKVLKPQDLVTAGDKIVTKTKTQSINSTVSKVDNE